MDHLKLTRLNVRHLIAVEGDENNLNNSRYKTRNTIKRALYVELESRIKFDRFETGKLNFRQ